MAPAILPILLGILAAAGVAGVVAAVDQPKAPAVPSQTTTNMQQAQATALQKRRGLASTELTSPLGVQGSTSTQKATLGT